MVIVYSPDPAGGIPEIVAPFTELTQLGRLLKE